MPKSPAELRFAALSPDMRAWIPVAQDVLRGRYKKASNSVKESLTLGFRLIHDPLTEEALLFIWGKNHNFHPEKRIMRFTLHHFH